LRLRRRIKELISRLDKPEKLDTTFVFPYSTDKELKRKQLIENLQKGLLLEDKGIFIPWLTPFNKVDSFKEQRRDSGDRTEWYLGKRPILDGYVGGPEIIMWMYLPWANPITEIKVDLSYDYQGMKNFHELKEHLIDRFGQPHTTDIHKWGDLDLGSIQWQFGKIKIDLVGIEHFAARYSFHIGLVRDRNDEYLKESIERMKASGLTEEELGK
jgi:hypothetical protein